MKDDYKMTELGEIPKNWEVVKLGNLANIKGRIGYRGYTKEDLVEKGKGALTIGAKHINANFHLNFDDPEYISWEKYEESPEIKVSVGDVLMVQRGSLGKIALVNELREPATINPSMVLLKEIKCNNVFLFYCLSGDYIQKDIEKITTSTAVPMISQIQIKNFNIALPSYYEQQKIAEILSTIDEKIDIIDAQINQTTELKKGLMQKLLTKGIGHTQFKDSPLGEIPESWAVDSIGNISTVVRGASPRPQGDPRYYGGNIPRLMGKDVSRDGKYVTPCVDFLTIAGAEKSRFLKAGTLVMICSGDVGVPSILAVDACVHDGFLAFPEISEMCQKEYLYYIFDSLRSQFNSSATHGGIFTNLTTSIIKEFKIPVPPVEEQQKIGEILSLADEKIKLLQNRKDSYEKLKKGLMQQLLTGKIRVNQSIHKNDSTQPRNLQTVT